MIIRNERPEDHRAVEALTKRAFWNVNVPGCDEHYIVHQMRSHPDFLPELALVAEEDGRIVGNVMYTKAWLEAADGVRKEILTFGPLSVLPECQRQGVGKALLEESFRRAVAMGYEAVVIFGNPENYFSRGFVSCKRFNIHLDGGIFPVALLAKELRVGALSGSDWTFIESDVCIVDSAEAEVFDRYFEPMEKAHRPSQELFYIYSQSRLV